MVRRDRLPHGAVTAQTDGMTVALGDGAARATIDVGDVVTLRASGEFDIDTARTLALALHEALRPGKDLVVDLTDATFMDLACLRLVLDAQRRLKALGCSVTVVHPPAGVRRMAELLHLTGLLAG